MDRKPDAKQLLAASPVRARCCQRCNKGLATVVRVTPSSAPSPRHTAFHTVAESPQQPGIKNNASEAGDANDASEAGEAIDAGEAGEASEVGEASEASVSSVANEASEASETNEENKVGASALAPRVQHDLESTGRAPRSLRAERS